MADPIDDEKEIGETLALPDDDSGVEDTEDGGAIVKLETEQDDRERLAHFANLVDEVDQDELKMAVSDLLDKIDRD